MSQLHVWTVLRDSPLQLQTATPAVQDDMLNYFPPIPDKAALSFQPPEIPTWENFDRLLQDYGGIPFNTETDLAPSIESETLRAANSGETSRYEVEQKASCMLHP